MIEECLLTHPYVIYCFMGLLSLAIGSLLNVIIYRLPRMMQQELVPSTTSDTPRVNLFFPRSFCPRCKAPIKAWHNIPLLSFILLKGRCALCRGKIPFRYPLVESLSLLLSLYASWHFGFTLSLVFVLPAIYITICLFFIDIDTQLLPDCLTLSLLWLGLVANTQHLFTTTDLAIVAAIVGYLSLWLVINTYYLLTGKIGMGNGDFKLFAALGAWFGLLPLPLLLLFSSLTGLVGGLLYLRMNRLSTDTPIPFGPFLCVAFLVYLLVFV